MKKLNTTLENESGETINIRGDVYSAEPNGFNGTGLSVRIKLTNKQKRKIDSLLYYEASQTLKINCSLFISTFTYDSDSNSLYILKNFNSVEEQNQFIKQLNQYL